MNYKPNKNSSIKRNIQNSIKKQIFELPTETPTFGIPRHAQKSTENYKNIPSV